MSVTREQVFSAIFERVCAIDGIATKARQLVSINQVAPEAMPAIYQVQEGQKYQWEGGGWDRGSGTPFVQLDGSLWLYVAPEDKPHSEALNPLIDAIEAIFAPDNAMRDVCTLGGLVNWARITGVEISEGLLGEKSIAVVTFSVFLPRF